MKLGVLGGRGSAAGSANRKRCQFLVLLAAVCWPGHFAAAQTEDGSGYTRPPESVVELFSRDKNHAVLNQPSPDGDHFLLPHLNELSTLERMSRPTYRLAMLEIRPRVNREWRLDTYGVDGLEIYSLSNRSRKPIQLPAGVLVSDMTWSPDGKKLAFLVHLETGSQVWTADVETGRAQALSSAPVMATLAAQRPPTNSEAESEASKLLQWTASGEVITLLVPSDRGAEPAGPGVAPGPIVRRTREKPTPTRTLPFLLRTRHDWELFRYYTTAQLALLAPGVDPRPIGQPAMYMGFSLAPNGRTLLVERLVEPFSYLVDYNRFPRRLETMDLSGRTLSIIRELPLREAIPSGPDRIEADLPRDVTWRPDGKGLGFLWKEPKREASKNGDEEGPEESSSNGKRLDRLMLLEEPFDLAKARVLASSERTLKQVSYSADGRFAFATLSGKRDGQGPTVERLVAWEFSSDEAKERVLVEDYDPKDVLKLPGEIVTARDGNGVGRALLSSDGASAYLRGQGFRKDFKPRPFVDRLNLSAASRERVFEGSAEAYESPLAFLDADLKRLIVARESGSDFPDSYLWSDGQTSVNLTSNRDPFPEITACRRIDFEFKRRDGLTIQARISLPVDYHEGSRVPALFWTYPREFESAQEYQRSAIRSRNQNEFTQLSYVRWSDIWLSQGYAVVYPDVPIIGKGDKFNDLYVSQLSDTLYAAIRKVDEMGLVDPDRVGHGGHSYGAFATANLLAHTPYFKAGIAGDGAYNRTLTPMSFQSEKRFIWEAEHLYLEMSPFFYADQINTPLLMYHGADDDNSGTFLIQSERMMQALTGLGKTAALYIYPYESHSPRCRENLLDMWARWLEWFDKYVKSPTS